MFLLTLRAYLLLLSFETVFARHDFVNLYRRVRQRPVRQPKPGITTDHICRAINLASAFYFKEVQCLQRSAALVCLLRTSGIPALLVIGAQRLPFRAHAWAEAYGRVVNDSDSTVEL